MDDAESELRRIAEDPEVQDALEVLRLFQVDGAMYDILINNTKGT